MEKVRKSIDIPKKEFQELQIKAVYKGVSVKKYIEDLIAEKSNSGAVPKVEKMRVGTYKSK